jgi:hypothetical protein
MSTLAIPLPLESKQSYLKVIFVQEYWRYEEFHRYVPNVLGKLAEILEDDLANERINLCTLDSGPGAESDFYVPVTVRKRAYMRSKTTVVDLK